MKNKCVGNMKTKFLNRTNKRVYLNRAEQTSDFVPRLLLYFVLRKHIKGVSIKPQTER